MLADDYHIPRRQLTAGRCVVFGGTCMIGARQGANENFMRLALGCREPLVPGCLPASDLTSGL